MKQQILEEIRRTAAQNGGRPLGVRKFEQVTGIRYTDWFGRYWKNWGDAVAEAGLVRNTLQGRTSDDEVLASYSHLVRELGRIPVKGDIRLKKLSNLRSTGIDGSRRSGCVASGSNLPLPT